MDKRTASSPGPRPPTPGPRSGFTLLEMIVASSIMAIAVVGLLSGLAGSARNAARLRDYDRAAQLAQLRMNELLLDEELPRNTEINGVFDRAITGGVESGWKAKYSLFEMPPTPVPGQVALERIELQVWWVSDAQRRTLTLDAFRRSVLKPEDIPPVAVPQ